MSGTYANDNLLEDDERYWSVDLKQLSHDNGIPIADIHAQLSWDKSSTSLSTMELAHRYKRSSGWEKTVLLIALMGKYAKPA